MNNITQALFLQNAQVISEFKLYSDYRRTGNQTLVDLPTVFLLQNKTPDIQCCAHRRNVNHT